MLWKPRELLRTFVLDVIARLRRLFVRDDF
jgi:hypothetical protein